MAINRSTKLAKPVLLASLFCFLSFQPHPPLAFLPAAHLANAGDFLRKIFSSVKRPVFLRLEDRFVETEMKCDSRKADQGIDLPMPTVVISAAKSDKTNYLATCTFKQGPYTSNPEKVNAILLQANSEDGTYITSPNGVLYPDGFVYDKEAMYTEHNKIREVIIFPGEPSGTAQPTVNILLAVVPSRGAVTLKADRRNKGWTFVFQGRDFNTVGACRTTEAMLWRKSILTIPDTGYGRCLVGNNEPDRVAKETKEERTRVENVLQIKLSRVDRLEEKLREAISRTQHSAADVPHKSYFSAVVCDPSATCLTFFFSGNIDPNEDAEAPFGSDRNLEFRLVGKVVNNGETRATRHWKKAIHSVAPPDTFVDEASVSFKSTPRDSQFIKLFNLGNL